MADVTKGARRVPIWVWRCKAHGVKATGHEGFVMRAAWLHGFHNPSERQEAPVPRGKAERRRLLGV